MFNGEQGHIELFEGSNVYDAFSSEKNIRNVDIFVDGKLLDKYSVLENTVLTDGCLLSLKINRLGELLYLYNKNKDEKERILNNENIKKECLRLMTQSIDNKNYDMLEILSEIGSLTGNLNNLD